MFRALPFVSEIARKSAWIERLRCRSSCGLPSAAESAATDAMSSPESGPPDIGATVAPGVAFTYAYNFALPEANIARVQGDHAAACEKLGIIHCRVTGMMFRKQAGEELSAMLSFKLDPAMANSFARGATDIVTRADGSLSSSDVTGNDAGSDIVKADRSNVALSADLTKINAQCRENRREQARSSIFLCQC